MFLKMINFKRLWCCYYFRFIFVLQTQQSIKHSVMLTYMVFQISYFTIYISAQQSPQGELVSGTSGMGFKRPSPTTFQHDQSAKKKPKRLQESDESGTIKMSKSSHYAFYTDYHDFFFIDLKLRIL